jgi:hypothetical protein
MQKLALAVLSVMKEVKGIDKSMTVGSGSNSYKGVPDQEVKKIIGESMQKNGLTILPTKITPITKVERWEETVFDNYQKKDIVKQKQSVFTEVTTEYLLLHESGESITISGYGHGVDSQDKGAGKATTYALKYALLYTFLVPTGKIDDADMVHSDSVSVAPKPKSKEQIEAETKLKACATQEALKNVYLGLSADMQKLTAQFTNELKAKLPA